MLELLWLSDTVGIRYFEKWVCRKKLYHVLRTLQLTLLVGRIWRTFPPQSDRMRNHCEFGHCCDPGLPALGGSWQQPLDHCAWRVEREAARVGLDTHNKQDQERMRGMSAKCCTGAPNACPSMETLGNKQKTVITLENSQGVNSNQMNNESRKSLKTAGELCSILLAPRPTYLSLVRWAFKRQPPKFPGWNPGPWLQGAERLYLKIIVCVCSNWSADTWRTDTRSSALLPLTQDSDPRPEKGWALPLVLQGKLTAHRWLGKYSGDMWRTAYGPRGKTGRVLILWENRIFKGTQNIEEFKKPHKYPGQDICLEMTLEDCTLSRRVILRLSKPAQVLEGPGLETIHKDWERCLLLFIVWVCGFSLLCVPGIQGNLCQNISWAWGKETRAQLKSLQKYFGRAPK